MRGIHASKKTCVLPLINKVQGLLRQSGTVRVVRGAESSQEREARDAKAGSNQAEEEGLRGRCCFAKIRVVTRPLELAV